MVNIDDEIARLEEELQVVQKRLFLAKEEKRREKSLSYIKEHNLHGEDIEVSYGECKPWFCDTNSFIAWLQDNSTKRWVEWNGAIYRTWEFCSPSFNWNMAVARMSDLPS